MAGVDGHPGHEDVTLLERALVRRYFIPDSKVLADRQIQRKTDGWTSSDGCKGKEQNEPDGFSQKSADAIDSEVCADGPEQVNRVIANAATVPATTATALLVPTCTPPSTTDTNKSITHESTGCSAARSTDTLHATQPPPLLNGGSWRKRRQNFCSEEEAKVGQIEFQERADRSYSSSQRGHSEGVDGCPSN